MSTKSIMKLLLIEDNPGDARLFLEMFREQGSETTEVTHVVSMLEAEKHLAAHEADIILLDLGLPDAEGLEAVRRAHAAAPRVPLVVLTIMDDESLAIRALQEGAQDYLIKGQIESGLLRALRYAIERKIMEEVLFKERTRSEEGWARLAAVHEATPDLVSISDPDGRLLYVNRGGRTMIGLAEDADITGHTLADFLPNAPTHVIATEGIPNAVRDGIWRGETELMSREGAAISISLIILAHKRSDGSLEFVSTIARDITASKRTDAALRLQSVALNAAANAMVITERDLTIVWINPAFTQLTGYTDEEAIGRNMQDLLSSGVHDQEFYEDIRNTLFAGESWSGEMTNRRKDGRLYPEAQTITPVKDEQETISHFISIKTDLTAQRQMEAQLRQAQKMEAVGQLAAGVAHEFNNLLQALMSMAAVMRSRGDHEQVAKIGTDMEFQIKRGANLTKQLLLFSRDVAVEKTGLDLREQVQKANVLLRQLIPENIRIVLETLSERLSVQADAGQLQQVLLNLAINARDAMPDGGTLTLRSGSCEGGVFLEVEDTGQGMNEVTRGHLFEPFFTTKGLGKGTGLGLAVVHGIVIDHGGRIEVQSRPSEGSRFRVILPVSLYEAVPTPELTVDAGVLAGRGRVLLVEDEDAVREGIAILLETIGYDVTAVSSGEEAVAISLDPAPDLLLTDVTLAGIGGSALGVRLRDRWPSLTVVLMSGYFDEASQADASEREWPFLQKPFEMTELSRILRAALEEKQPAAA